MKKNKYFLYNHVRLDKDEVFYIGMGTVNIESKKHKKKYIRAYSFSSRNMVWKKIRSKTDITVHILEEFDDLNECLKKETELILKYGRICDKSGTLANIISSNDEQTIARRTKKGMRRVKTYKYNLDGLFLDEYDSITNAAVKNNMRISDISNCMSGRVHKANGYIWSRIKTENINSLKIIVNTKKLKQYNFDGILINSWESVSDASRSLGISRTGISNVINKKSKSSGGFLWSYNGSEFIIKEDKLKVFTKNGEFINSYKTLSEAERDLGIQKNMISLYTRGFRNSKYYIFELRLP